MESITTTMGLNMESQENRLKRPLDSTSTPAELLVSTSPASPKRRRLSEPLTPKSLSPSSPEEEETSRSVEGSASTIATSTSSLSTAPGPPIRSNSSSNNNNNNNNNNNRSIPRAKIYHCTIPDCNKSFTRPCRLAEHTRSHTGERPFVCPHAGCDKTFQRDYHLHRHERSAHRDERPHVCLVARCGKAFSTAQRLREHVRTHERARRFACRETDEAEGTAVAATAANNRSSCDAVFRKKTTLLAHVALVHLGVKPFPCVRVLDEHTGEMCEAAYNTRGKLNEHVAKVHEGGPRFVCTLCAEGQNGFRTNAEMQKHKREMHPYKPAPLRVPLEGLVESEYGKMPTKTIKLRIDRRKKNNNSNGNKKSNINVTNPSSDAGFANVSASSLLTGVANHEPPSIRCLVSTCNDRLGSEDELALHCSTVHGMAQIEIWDCLREREALTGGVFWVGGIDPSTEELEEDWWFDRQEDQAEQAESSSTTNGGGSSQDQAGDNDPMVLDPNLVDWSHGGADSEGEQHDSLLD